MNEAAVRQKFNELILGRCGGSGERLYAPVGEAGYRLPAVDGLQWYPMPGGGTNNWILGSEPSGFQFVVAADSSNNFVLVDPQSNCRGRILIRGSFNTAIVIGGRSGSHPVNIHFHSSHHLFFFGRGSSSNTATFEMGTDGTAILVGEDCMFSAFVDVSTDDRHAIFDLDSGKHLNTAADVIFEPHVWAGLRTTFLKGVTMGFGSIVGAGSIVTRSVTSKTVVAGNPARPVRTGVNWTRQRHPSESAIDEVRRLEHDLHVPVSAFR
jgi:acetyltransferase-like isoleucine patch superfamily enzyme